MTHEINEIQKKMIVKKLNELRRAVKPPAANMLYMEWDKSLEVLAKEYSQKCVFAHNPVSSFQGLLPFIQMNE